MLGVLTVGQDNFGGIFASPYRWFIIAGWTESDLYGVLKKAGVESNLRIGFSRERQADGFIDMLHTYRTFSL